MLLSEGRSHNYQNLQLAKFDAVVDYILDYVGQLK